MELSPEKQKKVEQLISFAEDKDLAVFEAVTESNDKLDTLISTQESTLEVLKELNAKESPEYPEPKEVEFPAVQQVEVVNWPKPEKMPDMNCDFTETNKLLKQIVEKESEPLDISIELV